MWCGPSPPESLRSKDNLETDANEGFHFIFLNIFFDTLVSAMTSSQ